MKKTAKAPISAEFLPVIFLMGLAVALFFYHLGSYPLFDMDEPRYAEAAREMLERSSWITPTFNYEVRFDKPVLFYWLIAGAYQVFGITEFAARFFSAVSATSVLLMIYAFCRYWVSSRLGLFAAIIFATSLEVIGIGRMSITDMTLSGLMAAATLSLFMAAHHSKKWWLLGAVFSALAILTKGPVGIVVPGAILAIYTLLTGRFKETFLNRWFALALLLCAGLSLPWYLLAYLENGQVFLDALFLHNVNRFTGVVSGHDQPFFFFFIVLILGFLPWSPFLPSALRYWWQEMKTNHQDNARKNPIYWVALYGAIWSIFTFLFFTTAQTKLLTYILPLFPGLALWIGSTWYQARETGNNNLLKGLTLSSAGLFIVMLGIGITFLLHPTFLLPREARQFSDSPALLLPILCLWSGAGMMSLMLYKKRITSALVAQALAISAFSVVTFQGVMPEVNQLTQGTILSYLKKSDAKPLVTYEMTRPSLTYYGRKKIIHLVHEDRGKLKTLLQHQGILYVITKNNFLDDLHHLLPVQSQLTVVEKGSRYTLVRLTSSLILHGSPLTWKHEAP